MEKIDEGLINRVLEEAKINPRRRALRCFNQPEDMLQVMVNAGMRDTYIRPHKHENPDKAETFTILRGSVAVVEYDNSGEISDCAVIDREGMTKSVKIAPRTWHNFVVLSEEGALYEIIGGAYEAPSHKKFAVWAPEEGSPDAQKYLEGLRRRIANFIE